MLFHNYYWQLLCISICQIILIFLKLFNSKVLHELQEQFKSIFIACNITFEFHIQKLADGSTNGLELTIPTLCDIFGISVIVLCEDFLWKSEEHSLEDFHMVLHNVQRRQIYVCIRRNGQRFLLQLLNSLQYFLDSILNTNASCLVHQIMRFQRKRNKDIQ